MPKNHLQHAIRDAKESIKRSDRAGADQQETRELRLAIEALIEAVEHVANKRHETTHR